MPNNERVSQLIELFAADLHSEDLFLVTDMSQRESKKLEMGQLLLFIENSGSFNAFNANFAATASYVAGGNVDGMVDVANISSQSLSASWAAVALSSSYATTASFATFALSTLTGVTSADTASFLKYTGVPNGTASYAIKAAASDTTTTAFNLFYNGTPNGTASWAVRASNSDNSLTSSYADSFSVGPWSSTSTVYPLTIRGSGNDWASLFVSGTVDSGIFYIRTYDNGTEPIIFQTYDANGGAVPVNRVSINYRNANSGSTVMTVHGEITASSFTSSISNAVGFLGTASFAETASYISVFNNPIKAWACVTWSVGKSTPKVFQNSNINTFTFLNFFTSAGNATYYILPTTWSQYGVTFTSPTSNTDYIVMGSGMSPYQYPEVAQVFCHPIHGRRTTTGFTMSVVTQGSNDWFTITSGSYPLDEYPFINFQVIG